MMTAPDPREMVARARTYLDGFAGKNDLRVGPHMLADALEGLLSLPELSQPPEGWKRQAEEVIVLAELLGNTWGMEDGPCPTDGLCGATPCEQIGCLKLKADEARAMLSASPAVGVLISGWRPIETAPRDGTSILAFCVHDNARYAGEDAASWTEIVTTRWIDFNGGGWTWHGICGRHTHWMPLPEAPPPVPPVLEQGEG